MNIPTQASEAHVVSLPTEAYRQIVEQLPPASRFVNVEEWGFNHIWLYDPRGHVVIFTPEIIQKLTSSKLEGDIEKP